MNNRQYINCVVLLFILGATLSPLQQAYGQKKGVEQPKENIFKYSYQFPERWSGSKFSQKQSFAELSYISFGIGAEDIFGMSEFLGRGTVGVNYNVAFGYWLAPVHGLELKFGYGNLPYAGSVQGADGSVFHTSGSAKSYSMGLNYMFNFTSYASKLEVSRRWDLIGLAGASFKKEDEFSFGLNAGVRAQYNIRPGVSVFIEPSISVFDNKRYESSKNRLNLYVMPSITVGFSLRLNAFAQGYNYLKEKSKLSAQKGLLTDFAIKTNLLYDITESMNLGFEIGLGDQTTLDVSGNYNPWDRSDNSGTKHILIQPEFRYWLGERFKSHFFGGHAQYAFYNIGGNSWLANMADGIYGEGMKDYRYEGWLSGVGVSYGYLLRIGRRWGLEATVGFGYAYMDYKKYECETCGILEKRDTKHYFGPTKAGLSLIFMIK